MKKIILYALRYSRDRGLVPTLKATYIYLRSRFRSIFYNVTRIQLIAEKVSSKKGQLYSPWPSVLFVFASGAASGVYRVVNQVEQLVLQGLRSDLVSIWDIRLLNYVDKYDVIILNRVQDSTIMDSLLKKASHSGKIVIYDVDDLVFDPSLLKRPNPFATEIARSNGALLMKCDYVLTSVDYLANLLNERGKKVFVNRNCLNLEQIKVSEEACECRTPSDRVRLGYFSGTDTHDYDFLEATDALVKVMNKYETVDLYIAGDLRLSPKFEPYAARIKRLPFVNWRKLPFNIARVDINLAPLERDNVFSEGKSELKYFESGILGIPTIASPTGAFRFAIRHGENGLLASSTEEWTSCLELLINDREMRKRIGENARQHVKKCYNPRSRGTQFVTILNNINKQVHFPANESPTPD